MSKNNTVKKSAFAKRHNQLDYSFFKLESLDEIIYQNPRNLKDKSNKKKRHCDIAKLNNNLFSSINTIFSTLSEVTIDPRYITWIDLSFNQIAQIADEFTSFPKIQILYLHGNKISNIDNIANLANCQTLIKLALHGNPIETTKNYRAWVISLLPSLKSFDMSSVTLMDLHNAMDFFPSQQIADRITSLKRTC